jgi:phosphatidylserine/phosphatidylglycerophosphate/cardiolipin synthase-like enzyme
MFFNFIDEKAVLISSVNWNENSLKNNREVGVIIIGEPALYFANVFKHDWNSANTKENSNLGGIAILFVFLGLGLYY